MESIYFTVRKNHPILHSFGTHIRVVILHSFGTHIRVVITPTLDKFLPLASTIEVRLIATARGQYLSRRISLFERDPRIKHWNGTNRTIRWLDFPFGLSLRHISLYKESAQHPSFHSISRVSSMIMKRICHTLVPDFSLVRRDQTSTLRATSRLCRLSKTLKGAQAPLQQTNSIPGMRGKTPTKPKMRLAALLSCCAHWRMGRNQIQLRREEPICMGRRKRRSYPPALLILI